MVTLIRRTRVALVVIVAVVLLVGAFAAIRLWSVHQETSDWVFAPKEVPSKVQFAGREYNCGPDPRPTKYDIGLLSLQGLTARGGVIFAQEPSSSARVFIVVRTSEGAFGCDLMGGP
ncbi:hypothetical protein [Paenarthrobacter sp. NPDC090522]|uniref:hypothetical protein n=1 Tax=Paenarthrobacter sp. NPDC090522 TaxID=3364383 RepID=UPI00381BBD08